MARKKIKLEWITNDAARRATFKKRRKGLMKKVSELSTLCDVKACLIVYGHNEAVPEVWPSTREAVSVLARLKSMPDMEQSKKMMNQEGFMRQRIAKLQDQLRKQDRENRELEARLLMNQSLMAAAGGGGGGGGLEGVGAETVTSLAWLIETEMNMVKKRIEGYNNNNNNKGGGDHGHRNNGKGKAATTIKVEEEASSMTSTKEKSAMEVAMEELQRQEWFTDVMNPGAAGMMMQQETAGSFYGAGDHHSFVGCWPNNNNNNNNNNGGQGSSSNPNPTHHENICPWVDPYFPWN